jgi:hypothetical protein
MKGKAEIITKNISVLDRLFFNFKVLVTKSILMKQLVNLQKICFNNLSFS